MGFGLKVSNVLKPKKAQLLEAMVGIILGSLLLIFLFGSILPKFIPSLADYNQYVDDVVEGVKEVTSGQQAVPVTTVPVRIPKKSAILIFSKGQKNITLLYSELKKDTALKKIVQHPVTSGFGMVVVGLLIGTALTIGATFLAATFGVGGFALIAIVPKIMAVSFSLGFAASPAVTAYGIQGFQIFALELNDLLGPNKYAITFDKPSICGDDACVCLVRNVRVKPLSNKFVKMSLLASNGQQLKDETVDVKPLRAVYSSRPYCLSLNDVANGNVIFLTNLGTVDYYKNMANYYGGVKSKAKYLDRIVKVAYIGLTPLQGYVLENGITEMPNLDTRVLHLEYLLGGDDGLILGVCEYPPCVNEVTKRLITAPFNLRSFAEFYFASCVQDNNVLNCDCDLQETINQLESSGLLDLITVKKYSSNDQHFFMQIHWLQKQELENLKKSVDCSDPNLEWVCSSDASKLAKSTLLLFYNPSVKQSVFKKLLNKFLGVKKDYSQLIGIYPLKEAPELKIEYKNNYYLCPDFRFLALETQQGLKLKPLKAYCALCDNAACFQYGNVEKLLDVSNDDYEIKSIENCGKLWVAEKS